MFFNSIDFAIFLPIVFVLYWFVTNRNLKLQNALIVVVSYVFYGWWDWRFLSLLFFSTLVDYSVGVALSKEERIGRRKLFLLTSIFVNLGFLGFFKYYNFFIDNFISAFTFFGASMSPRSLQIILPVGISFYTFQTLSYSIDVYKKQLEPTKDLINFMAFVSFFPQLVAGPIERASNLLPQFYVRREFDYHKAVDGLRQILWGLFKKIVIADNCAIYANDIFTNYTDYNGSTLLLGGFFFAFQIYGDFSGYSDIAIGTARLFGFTLMQNFSFPYFSRDIAEFWRKWHISLSTWFRDYLYIPLGGSRGSVGMKIRNTFIIFLVSGFWHGANWTFVVWGALHAIYFLPLMLLNRNRLSKGTVAQGHWLPTLKESIQVGSNFILVIIAWIFFRANNMEHAISYLRHLFSKTLFSLPIKDLWAINTGKHIIYLTIFLAAFILTEWLQREKQYGLELTGTKIPPLVRRMIYFAIIIACFVMNGVQQSFIYFQF